MPPEAVKVDEPVALPKHNTLVTAVAVLKADTGCVIVIVRVALMQLFASTALTVYEPAGWALIALAVAAVDQV